jgi:hypothetical protein
MTRFGRAGCFVVVVALCSGRASGQQPSTVVDRAFIQDAVESLSAVVAREYFDAAVANRMADALREHLRGGRYDAPSNLESFARALARDLLEATSDQHLVVLLIQT